MSPMQIGTLRRRAAQAQHTGWHDRRSHGMAALTVVMGIFFVMALVAAYTNRNMIFEQRTSANSYRAERAVTAADAAADWALVMLNTGRVDNQCRASVQATDTDFRSRYLTLDPVTGGYGVLSQAANPFFPGCLTTRGDVPTLSCACPTTDNRTIGVDAPAGYLASSFRVSFGLESGHDYTPPGALILQVRGCANSGTGASSCQSQAVIPTVDALSLVRAHVGLVRALPAAPVATLTAGQTASAPGVALAIANNDGHTGLTVHTGGAADMTASTFTVPAGAAGDGQASNDPNLAALTAGGRFFENMFGMSATLYKNQPAVVRVSCPATGCTLANLTAANWLTGYPGRTVVVDGNLTLDSALTDINVGSTSTPVMLVVTGDLSWSTPMNLTGFLYARNIAVSGLAVNSTVRGALVAAQTFSSSVVMTLGYDAAVLNLISKGFGSFVRIPGGWNRGA